MGRGYAVSSEFVKKYIVDIKGKALTEKDKEMIERSVDKTIKEYGEVLKWLGNE